MALPAISTARELADIVAAVLAREGTERHHLTLHTRSLAISVEAADLAAHLPQEWWGNRPVRS
jgi:hypothetical protein